MTETATLSPREVEPSSQAIVLFTPTFYKNWQPPTSLVPGNPVDIDRGNLAIKTLSDAQSQGYQIVVVDGGSSPAFLQALQERGITAEPQRERGISAARRQGLALASALPEAKALVVTEPEKDSLVESIDEGAKPVLQDETDIVVLGREEELFQSTYPEFQYKSEAFANRWFNRLLHAVDLLPPETNLDWFFGPRVIKNDPRVVALFNKTYRITDPQLVSRKRVDPERYSNFNFFPVIAALKEGMRVVGVTVPFRYPPSQKAIEDQLTREFLDKRVMQRQSILAELFQYVRFITNNPKNKLIDALQTESENFR